MRRVLPFVLVALAGCLGTADDGGSADGSGGQGADGSGGSMQEGSGGSGSGGSVTGSGGHGTGGAATGGVVGSGGHVGSGGIVGSGGHVGSGGIVGSGGVVGSGGRVGSGGITASGGIVGSGGALGSGGIVGSGGAGGRGGRAGTGGAGGAQGTGGAGAGGTTPVMCSSGKMWTNGNGQDMRPGNDCTGCHSFTIAGTVYPTAHEPNNCDGTAAGGIKVVITGADGSMMTLTPSATSGNFYSSSAIKTPFTAQVVNSSGAVRMMMASQTKGNCNSCHTQDGASGAPGRIMAP